MANDGNRLAPYERRVIELLRNSKDKRARKLAKKRVCLFYTLLYTTLLEMVRMGTDENIARYFRSCEGEGR